VRPDLPAALTAAVGWAMAEHHGARPAPAAAFRDRLLETRTAVPQLRAA
jgi:hypothetical protein